MYFQTHIYLCSIPFQYCQAVLFLDFCLDILDDGVFEQCLRLSVVLGWYMCRPPFDPIFFFVDWLVLIVPDDNFDCVVGIVGFGVDICNLKQSNTLSYGNLRHDNHTKRFGWDIHKVFETENFGEVLVVE